MVAMVPYKTWVEDFPMKWTTFFYFLRAWESHTRKLSLYERSKDTIQCVDGSHLQEDQTNEVKLKDNPGYSV